ncbi:hypothetical protein AVEN_257835-1 [Araneus ventricosus]|uniref:Uncharacterized protein n=1 Tax=Araneus ventricosus TaxID=182803 RepID=A0A4Y2VKK4_ARAVE|nr:hypothetical protein AVEN_257835-1 [Araneus ventricosus]
MLLPIFRLVISTFSFKAIENYFETVILNWNYMMRKTPEQSLFQTSAPHKEEELTLDGLNMRQNITETLARNPISNLGPFSHEAEATPSSKSRTIL